MSCKHFSRSFCWSSHCVAPSYWSHTPRLPMSLSFSSRRVCSISTYWSDVTLSGFSSQKVRAPYIKFCNYNTQSLVHRIEIFHEAKVIFQPVVKILLIDAAREMKVSLVTCEKNSICRNILKDIVTTSHVSNFPSLLAVPEHHLYRWNFRLVCKIYLTAQSDNLKACLQAEHIADCTTDCLTAWTFSGVWEFQGLPVGFLLGTEPVAQNFSTYGSIDFLSKTASF